MGKNFTAEKKTKFTMFSAQILSYEVNKLQGKTSSQLQNSLVKKYSLFHILSVRTDYEEFSNLKRIEKKIEKSSIKPIIGFDREVIK